MRGTKIHPGTRALFLASLVLGCVACSADNADLDGDGLSDAEETLVHKTNPWNPDTDGDGIPDGQETLIAMQFDNQVMAGAGGPCSPWATNTVTVFLPGLSPAGIPLAQGSTSGTYRLSTGSSGVGIQVNFWYWSQEPDVPVGPASGSKPQNPDNSGGQFLFEPDCTFTARPAAYGKGIETYIIADIASALVNGICVVTIQENSYTGCVTPNCCSPMPGTGECQDVLPRQYACPAPPPA